MSTPPDSTIDRSLLAATFTDLKTARALIQNGRFHSHWEEMEDESVAAVEQLADRLDAAGIGLLALGDERFPPGLARLSSPPAYLFFIGNLGLLSERSVGFSGSRDANEEVLAATRDCAAVCAGEGRPVVSGMARGVDLAAHSAALGSGGSTVAVLPEGILNARIDLFSDDEPVLDRILVVSQFPADARWMAGRAMSRNSTIIALSQCLVVMSAGETGGSAEAGRSALKAGVPVIAPSWPGGLTPGASELVGNGAVEVDSLAGFAHVLSEVCDVASQPDQRDVQGSLFDQPD